MKTTILIIFLALISSNTYAKILAEYKDGHVSEKDIQDTLDAIAKNSGTSSPKVKDLSKDVLSKIVTEDILVKLIIKEAKKNKIQDTPEYQNALAYLSRDLLQKIFIRQEVINNITEEQIKARYQLKAKNFNPNEIRASHILVESESEAKQLLELIRTGKKTFIELAKQKSKDLASGSIGGDLGYFSTGQMVKSFEDSAFSLNVNQLSEPIKTDFGWHIIQVTDKRKNKLPTFEEAKMVVRREIEDETISQYAKKLLDQTEIKMKD